jgi:uncharacterized protein YjiS (DUF1127 family)
MEMIMSTISSTADRRADAGSDLLTVVVVAAKRLCVTYFTWRVERAAIGLLNSTSDRELKDLGLTRSEIARIVLRPDCERSCRTCSIADRCAAARSVGAWAASRPSSP